MGFDLYGKNPENPTGLPKPYLNWSENVTEEQKEVYFKELEVYEKAVPGDYFRANVWCWRPIWNFVAYHCDDILNEEDLERGSYNDGHFINKAKAKKLYTRIMSKIKDGTAQRMQERYEKESVKAKAHNDKIDAKIDELKERVKKETKKNNIVPSDYPPPYKEEWNQLYGTRSWGDSYPFNVEYLKEFAEFSRNSGGFEIC
mgnify:CR=1 FL=1|tara:strand:- start:49776 stop:50378 length:603 start_codon:yes stop_codon:yes gene_type:complete